MRRRTFLTQIGLGAALAVPGATRWRPVAARQATPETTASDSFAGLLARVPDLPAAAEPGSFEIARYANLALQFATLGQPPGGDSESSWWDVADWQQFPLTIADYVATPRWRPTFGFGARQVDLAIGTGTRPDEVCLLQGRFDLDEVRGALTTSGYGRIDVPEAEIFSWAAEPDLDFESEVTLLGLGGMNNAAILPDGALLFTGSLERLRGAIAAASGNAPALSARPEVAALVAAFDPAWTSGYLVQPEAVQTSSYLPPTGNLAGDALAQDIATRIAAGVEPLPRPDLVAVGMTAGGPVIPRGSTPEATPIALPPGVPQALVEIALLYPARAEAEAASPVVDARLSQADSLVYGTPYRMTFPAWDIRIVGEAPILLIQLEPGPNVPPGRIFQLLWSADLRFVAWDA